MEVETLKELEKAISEKTAMLFFLNVAEPKGQISRAEWIEVAKKHKIPSMNDCASDVPPKERLSQYVDEGFDLVVFSGGKGLLGPQASGLVLGRPDLVEGAQKAISPRAGIGRGMKVGKEEIMGLVAAVERYHRIDHDAERRELDARAKHVIETASAIDGVEAEVHIPPIANQVPHVPHSLGRGKERADPQRRLQEATRRRAFDRGIADRRRAAHLDVDAATGRAHGCGIAGEGDPELARSATSNRQAGGSTRFLRQGEAQDVRAGGDGDILLAAG